MTPRRLAPRKDIIVSITDLRRQRIRVYAPCLERTRGFVARHGVERLAHLV